MNDEGYLWKLHTNNGLPLGLHPSSKACANHITVTRIFPHWPMGFTFVMEKAPVSTAITEPVTEMGVAHAFEPSLFHTF